MHKVHTLNMANTNTAPAAAKPRNPKAAAALAVRKASALARLAEIQAAIEAMDPATANWNNVGDAAHADDELTNLAAMLCGSN